MNGLTTEPPPLVNLSQDEKAYAGLAHALMIPTWWIGPLIIFFMKRQSRFVSFHALQALLWQIVFTVSYIFGIVILVSLAIICIPRGTTTGPEQFPVALFIVFPVFWLIVMGGIAVSMTLGILYCLRAMRGQWSGYPVIGNWARKILGE